MKLSRQIMELMSDGEQWSVQRLCDATGEGKVRVQQTVVNIINGGYAISTPVVYQLTPVGHKRLKQEPQSDEVVRERARIRMAMRRKREKDRIAAEKAERANQTRPALDMAWMSVAREQEATHV